MHVALHGVCVVCKPLCLWLLLMQKLCRSGGLVLCAPHRGCCSAAFANALLSTCDSKLILLINLWGCAKLVQWFHAHSSNNIVGRYLRAISSGQGSRLCVIHCFRSMPFSDQPNNFTVHQHIPQVLSTLGKFQNSHITWNVIDPWETKCLQCQWVLLSLIVHKGECCVLQERNDIVVTWVWSQSKISDTSNFCRKLEHLHEKTVKVWKSALIVCQQWCQFHWWFLIFLFCACQWKWCGIPTISFLFLCKKIQKSRMVGCTVADTSHTKQHTKEHSFLQCHKCGCGEDKRREKEKHPSWRQESRSTTCDTRTCAAWRNFWLSFIRW